MTKDRKFFQTNLRKGVDIKSHITSNMLSEMKSLTEQIQDFSKKVAKEIAEKEK